LLLQRFGKFAGALAQLIEQASVLDGDDGLGGRSSLKSSICFFVKRDGPLAGKWQKAPSSSVFLKQRHYDR